MIDPFSQMKQEYLTIILRARLGSESIEHEAEWAIDSELEAMRARGITVLAYENPTS